jgi:hypothetical protein
MKTLLTPLLALALCAGCRTYQPTEYAPTKDTRVVKIETDPPGMRIYFGKAGTETLAVTQRQYVGQSPCTLTVPCDGEGRFVNTISDWRRPKAIFEAEPPHGSTNLYAQKQIFAVPAFFTYPPPIPGAVFFDMHKPGP